MYFRKLSLSANHKEIHSEKGRWARRGCGGKDLKLMQANREMPNLDRGHKMIMETNGKI